MAQARRDGLATRSLLQPDPTSGRGRRLHIGKKAAAQLSTPNLLSTTSGCTQIDSQKAMEARSIKSPDRAEAALLALYEPEP
ncbi:hypothetical protein [Streptomyces sp. NPDC048650]|uniref:hypothetical protein n=1 Tax=Streptomyces sp. NPDC048650 TaxID=3365583 RepID=UPI0037202EFD